MTGNRNDWFPTPIWMFKVDNCQEMNQELLQAIYGGYSQYNPGKELSCVLGLDNIDSWHWRKTYNDFIRIVTNNVMEAATFLSWDLSKCTIDVANCWALINNQYNYNSNSVQNYSNSLLSGIYYVKAPLNCGGVFFNDPRPAAQILVPPVSEFNMWTLPRITYKAYEGTMLIFPSWLMHGAESNLSGEDRVSINFNIGMLPI
jgi:uncharacterized protein (TIGR02466 family)